MTNRDAKNILTALKIAESDLEWALNANPVTSTSPILRTPKQSSKTKVNKKKKLRKHVATVKVYRLTDGSHKVYMTNENAYFSKIEYGELIFDIEDINPSKNGNWFFLEIKNPSGGNFISPIKIVKEVGYDNPEPGEFSYELENNNKRLVVTNANTIKQRYKYSLFLIEANGDKFEIKDPVIGNEGIEN